jgi:hypothetical protein
MEEHKLDQGKILADLPFEYFPNAYNEVAKVCTFGAEKYGRGTWRNVYFERYQAALFRHFNAFYRGELTDEESGLPHLSHALWNLNAIVEIMNEDKQ